MRTVLLNPLRLTENQMCVDILGAFRDSYFDMRTLLSLLDGTDSLLILNYILWTEQFVIITIRIAP